MILETAVHPLWGSNAYLVAASPGSPALVIDPGAPAGEFLRRARELDLDITHVVITHRHDDHHEHATEFRDAYPNAKILCHMTERPYVPVATEHVVADTVLEIGELTLRVLETPGHTAGAISLLVDGRLFTGDTLYRGSIGGLVSPGHTVFSDLKRSVMEVVLTLPPETIVLPGHDGQTTIGRELETNPFVRVWAGRDPEGDQPCKADGEPARLIVWARDYDDGYKAWVRHADGTDLVLAGSRVELPW
jgi:glyoxylase-like metal-dependent hydrolase (beta-lactamase superfamily II)